MWRGVAKCGSPAPKSTMFAPWERSLAASAVTAIVAETSIRPMRSVRSLAVVETVILIFWQNSTVSGNLERASLPGIIAERCPVSQFLPPQPHYVRHGLHREKRERWNQFA